ncbi:MAG: hypothetical protein ACT4QA_20010 [Panacagrimonas sp.]
MSVDAHSTLVDLRGFLSGAVLAAVPHGLRSELRAAIKVLEEVEAELDALPGLVPPECERLLTLCAESVEQLETTNSEALALRISTLRHELRDEARGLRARIALHQELLHLSAGLLVQLQQSQRALPPGHAQRNRLRPVLRNFLLELRDQAKARQAWQSVFPSF